MVFMRATLFTAIYLTSFFQPALSFQNARSPHIRRRWSLNMLAIFDKNSEQPMTTRHLKLSQLFSKSRDYLFSITKNVRFYEWTQEEVETLYSDLVESMMQHPKSTYELNQFIAIRTQKDTWEVADGQQRLITLCLLYAAIRDSREDQHPMARHIQESLVPTYYGQQNAFRVALRKKHSVVFEAILSGTNDDLLQSLDSGDRAVQKLIAQNFQVLCNAVQADAAKDPEFLDKFFAYLSEQTYIYLTIPENQAVARKLIGGSRRGKDTEPIDEFKSMVVFLGIESEAEQDKTMEEWISLEDKVGRGTLEDACMLMAQGGLGQRVKRDGAVDILEAFWKRSTCRNGREFFDNVIEPGVLLLYRFRRGEIDRSNADSIMKWAFLSQITRVRSAAQTLEIAVLAAMRFIDASENPEYLEHVLNVLERLGLWFATASVKVIPRHNRVFAVCKAIRKGEPLDNFDLTLTESLEVLESLDVTEFGLTGSKRKIAAAILGRADAALASQSSEAYIDGTFTVEHVLPVQPSSDSPWEEDWDSQDKQEWQHRLGNLCLVNGRKNSASSNSDFTEKKALYKQTTFPVTLRISKFDQWQKQELESQHNWMLGHCQSFFELKTVGDPVHLIK